MLQWHMIGFVFIKYVDTTVLVAHHQFATYCPSPTFSLFEDFVMVTLDV